MSGEERTIPAVPAVEQVPGTGPVPVWLAANRCTVRELGGGDREPMVGLYSRPDGDGDISIRFIITPEESEELARQLRKVAKAARKRR